MPYALTKSRSMSAYEAKQSDSVCGRPRRAFGALPQFLRYVAYSPLHNSDKLAKCGRAEPADLSMGRNCRNHSLRPLRERVRTPTWD